MSTNGGPNKDIPPPSDKKFEIKDKISLVFELVWMVLLILPHTLLGLVRRVLAPEKSLKGQVALVTGAGRGLGKGVAVALGLEGCKVAVVDINEDNAKQTAQEICRNGGQAKAYFTNVARVEEVRRLREAITKDFGPVDLLVNNAALIYFNSVEKYPDEAITGIINVNLVSHFWMIREFLPEMRKRNSGHIVAMNSSSAFAGLANNSAYLATRFGLRGFMESLRDELESINGNNIKTTSIFPYFTNTSSHYINQWDLRNPPLSTDCVVKSTIGAIKREDVNISMPFYLYYLLQLRWFFPEYVYDLSHHIIYTRILQPSKAFNESLPHTAIMKDLAKERLQTH